MERNEAIDLGLHIYDTGRPCKYGHESKRYTGSGICVACAKLNSGKHAKLQNRRLVARRENLVEIRTWIHKEDAEAITAAIDACNNLRGIKTMCDLTNAVPDGVDIYDPDQLYALHVRMHGREFADRFRATAPPVVRPTALELQSRWTSSPALLTAPPVRPAPLDAPERMAPPPPATDIERPMLDGKPIPAPHPDCIQPRRLT